MDLLQTFDFDVDAGALVSLTDDVLVALARRSLRYDVIVQHHPPARHGETTMQRSPLEMGSVCIGVHRAPAESNESHLARLQASVQAGIAIAPLLARRTSPVPHLEERWALLHALALGGQLHYATSLCLLPVPDRAHGWRCLVRSHDAELRLVTLGEPGMGLVRCIPWTGPTAPDMGGGLAKNDQALRAAFEPLQTLARAYWSDEIGSTTPAKQAWRLAVRAVVREEWWTTYEALADEFLTWG